MQEYNDRQLNEDSLVNGSILAGLKRLTIPGTFGHLAMLIFLIIDLFFVSLLGTDALAAMSFSMSISIIIFTIAAGLGMGITSITSVASGSKDFDKVRIYSLDSSLVSLGIILIIVILGYLTINTLFSLMGAETIILSLVYEYMSVWYIGILMLAIPMMGNSILRGVGDMKTPLINMSIASGTNLILDPCLIFGIGPIPKMGLKGAAVASLIAAILSVFYTLYILIYKRKLLKFQGISLIRIKSSGVNLFRIAFYGILISSMTPIGYAFLTSLTSSFSEQGVSAFGVGSRIELLSLSMILALADSVLVIIGQNWSAAKYDRLIQCMKYCFKFSFYSGIFIYIVLVFSGNYLAAIFTDDKIVIENVINYLLIIPLSYPFQSIAILACPFFISIGKPNTALVIVFFRFIGFLIPLAYIGKSLYGLVGLFIGITISNILIGLLSFYLGNNSLKNFNVHLLQLKERKEVDL